MRMNSKVELYPFVDVGTHLCAGFFSCPKRRLQLKTGWMEYDFATTPFSESEQNNAAVRFRGRHRKTTFEKTANNPQIFQETVPFYTRDFSYLWGSRLTVKTVIFRRFLFVGAPNGLRIVCGISIRKSVNSAGLEQDFSRQKQAFYSCCDYRYHDPKCDYD